jgi:hypothetical protein
MKGDLIMSYFDNANNKVTRKSFGSKVDKEFKREGVIPVRDRSNKDADKLTESAARYKDLNKKVNDRRLQDLKDRKSYDTKIQEGYKNLKDDLMKDFISEICIESLLVDEEVVNENFKNIVELVERQIDDIGGFEGVKRIAESTRNPILLNMVSVCETTAKKVGERNIKEGKQNKDNLNYGLNKLELEEFDYRKKDIGSETIVNNIKEKVFQVVQDEQKMNADRQMVMDDIQNKVSELEAPVEEAMKFIFEKPGIEEDTLFSSMMRYRYKNLLESNSSAIFESFDYKDSLETLFEDSEFEMDDISLDELDPEDEKEIEDMFINECQKLLDVEDEDYNTALENFYNIVSEGSQNIKSYTQAKHFNHVVRLLQEELEYMEEKYVRNIQKHARKISNKKLDKSITKWEKEIEDTRNKIKNEKDPVYLDDYREDLRILQAELKALKAEKSHRGNQLKIAKQANPYMKSTMENVENVKKRLNDLVEETDDIESDMKEMNKTVDDGLKAVKDGKGKKVSEEVILCPKCGKEECSCKVAKESNEEDLLETYIEKLEDIAESMSTIVEAHEEARTNVTESLTREIKDQITLVPYLQTKDVNLNNLEFIYKTRIVCETLKNNLRYVESTQEAATLKRAVDLNIQSINETLEVIKDREDMQYKVKMLKAGKRYLNKINERLIYNSEDYVESVVETSSVFNSPEDVEKIFENVREYYVIESTDNDLMEMVMAEAIVEYTILETFNTLNLIKYTKDSVRQMARKNINK